jgi:uncharacterized protein
LKEPQLNHFDPPTLKAALDSYRSLTFITTYQCTAACRECCFESSPTLKSDRLDSELMNRVIQEAIAISPPADAPRPASGERVREIQFGKTDWRLPGSLTMPVGMAPIATVVMMHGSGALDRDSTIGANHLFKDLAAQLSDRGIASFRHEKRTRHYAVRLATLSDLTLDDETIDDAVAATEMIASQSRAGASCLLLLGHSLGAYLAPRIHRQLNAELHVSLVLLAPPGRPMIDVLSDQIDFLLADAASQGDDESALRLEKQKVAAWRLHQPGSLPQLPWGASACAFLDGYGPIEEWRSSPVATLALFGDKDYQVTQKDAAAWSALASTNPLLEVQTLSGLGHIFTPAHGSPSPRIYRTRAVADVRLSDAIAQFAAQQCQGRARSVSKDAN